MGMRILVCTHLQKISRGCSWDMEVQQLIACPRLLSVAATTRNVSWWLVVPQLLPGHSGRAVVGTTGRAEEVPRSGPGKYLNQHCH